ncbi:hypothetical protein DLAC_01273 [Tieghemostelium lacteum]|uniref:Uncharacterized protein n=1 Tax=Tieghemostelium lacteum TaxID=361077 RepID=A0A152A874_TIELA|nr:hypothetical protein DLAC_01273 [Tieghemostelium lacteum]|eukprot:KYR02433.1 hypothetical protein DLAC_01273 [Tieghemostelium lacteum]
MQKLKRISFLSTGNEDLSFLKSKKIKYDEFRGFVRSSKALKRRAYYILIKSHTCSKKDLFDDILNNLAVETDENVLTTAVDIFFGDRDFKFGILSELFFNVGIRKQGKMLMKIKDWFSFIMVNDELFRLYYSDLLIPFLNSDNENHFGVGAFIEYHMKKLSKYIQTNRMLPKLIPYLFKNRYFKVLSKYMKSSRIDKNMVISILKKLLDFIVEVLDYLNDGVPLKNILVEFVVSIANKGILLGDNLKPIFKFILKMGDSYRDLFQSAISNLLSFQVTPKILEFILVHFSKYLNNDIEFFTKFYNTVTKLEKNKNLIYTMDQYIDRLVDLKKLAMTIENYDQSLIEYIRSSIPKSNMQAESSKFVTLHFYILQHKNQDLNLYIHNYLEIQQDNVSKTSIDTLTILLNSSNTIPQLYNFILKSMIYYFVYHNIEFSYKNIVPQLENEFLKSLSSTPRKEEIDVTVFSKLPLLCAIEIIKKLMYYRGTSLKYKVGLCTISKKLFTVGTKQLESIKIPYHKTLSAPYNLIAEKGYWFSLDLNKGYGDPDSIEWSWINCIKSSNLDFLISDLPHTLYNNLEILPKFVINLNYFRDTGILQTQFNIIELNLIRFRHHFNCVVDKPIETFYNEILGNIKKLQILGSCCPSEMDIFKKLKRLDLKVDIQLYTHQILNFIKTSPTLVILNIDINGYKWDNQIPLLETLCFNKFIKTLSIKDIRFTGEIVFSYSTIINKVNQIFKLLSNNTSIDHLILESCSKSSLLYDWSDIDTYHFKPYDNNSMKDFYRVL